MTFDALTGPALPGQDIGTVRVESERAGRVARRPGNRYAWPALALARGAPDLTASLFPGRSLLIIHPLAFGVGTSQG